MSQSPEESITAARSAFLADPSEIRALQYLREGRRFYASSEVMLACVDEILASCGEPSASLGTTIVTDGG